MSSKMIKFKRIVLDKKQGILPNIRYFPQIVILYQKYSKFLNDDYFDKKDVIQSMLDLIEKTTPYFWVITAGKNEDFAGFVFLDNFIGNEKILHSAEVTTCFLPDYWGDFTKICSRKFFKYCFLHYGFKKIKACIFPQNSRVRGILKQSGFISEGILKSETLKNGKLQDVEVFARFP